jgi:hypothetical protein
VLRVPSPWLRQRHRDAGIVAFLDLFAIEVAAIGNRFQYLDLHHLFRGLGHIGEL